jgi:hypothetical protein
MFHVVWWAGAIGIPLTREGAAAVGDSEGRVAGSSVSCAAARPDDTATGIHATARVIKPRRNGFDSHKVIPAIPVQETVNPSMPPITSRGRLPRVQCR